MALILPDDDAAGPDVPVPVCTPCYETPDKDKLLRFDWLHCLGFCVVND
jgi:hypothetical protein